MHFRLRFMIAAKFYFLNRTILLNCSCSKTEYVIVYDQ